MTKFSSSLTLPVMNSAIAAGTKVTERIIAPSSAVTTVNAIGWNIFLDPGEGEDRQVHHHDDDLAEDQRPARLPDAAKTSWKRSARVSWRP